jgi:nickel/cobalt exporter
MPDFLHALQNGSTTLWVYIPAAMLVGALHGLEPGHSKTMMAAFIIAIRGTMAQAVLLGLSAAISHSLLIALLAAVALHFGSQWNTETVEPYLQLGSAAAIIALAGWMFLRTRRELHAAHQHHHHRHGHGHGHDHHDHAENEPLALDTGLGKLELSVFEKDVPPVFRLRAPTGETLPADASVAVETLRPDGARQSFAFAAKDGFLESRDAIPEPHEFEVVLTLMADGAPHTARAEFREDEHHHARAEGHDYQDAHELEHASDIRQRFEGRTVTTPQIMLFGVTGGLIPCPAAFSILLVCLQLKRAALGVIMVVSFSAGLAVTMVATGAIAAWSVRHAQRKFRGFGDAMRRAPYISCVVLAILAAFMAWHGWQGLRAR